MRGNPRVRIAQEQDGTALEPMASREGPTATASGIALRSADFATLAEALDYAATGDSGFNFYDGRGALTARLPYRDLRARALELAKRLAPLGRGQRLALVADTHPDFAVMLYACQYAGLVPVPLPAAVHLGGREVYIRHLRKLMRDCEAVAAFAPPDFIGFLREATDGLPLYALRHHGRVHGARRRRRAAAAARRPTSSPTCSTPRAAPASRAAR